MSNIVKSFRIKLLRSAHNLTAKEIAVKLELPISKIEEIEKNPFSNISEFVLQRITIRFNLTPKQFIRFTNEYKSNEMKLESQNRIKKKELRERNRDKGYKKSLQRLIKQSKIEKAQIEADQLKETSAQRTFNAGLTNKPKKRIRLNQNGKPIVSAFETNRKRH